jgi:hypothetical protein
MFQGIKTKSVASYSQIFLETLINGNSKGNRWDYCFLWCLCYGFVKKYKIEWDNIVKVLKTKEAQKYFNIETGLCLDLYGFQGKIANDLGFDMIAIRPDVTMTPDIKVLQSYIESNNIEDYYIMCRYEPEHYTYVDKEGIEVNPYPYPLKNSFYGWRLYKWEKK